MPPVFCAYDAGICVYSVESRVYVHARVRSRGLPRSRVQLHCEARFSAAKRGTRKAGFKAQRHARAHGRRRFFQSGNSVMESLLRFRAVSRKLNDDLKREGRSASYDENVRR